MDLSNKTALVYDRGLYTYLAQKLGESFKHVYYYIPDSSLYPKSPKSEIGRNLPEIERIDDDGLWKCIDKVDVIFFFDCYDSGLQTFLRSKGYLVFGSGLSSRIELDKTYFLETLKKLSLPCPYTYRAEGIDDLISHLTGKTDRWLKTPYYRGDFETYHFQSLPLSTPWLNDLKAKIGIREKNIEILVQSPIESEAEVGYDGFCLDGEFTSNCLCGYEVKDKGLVAKVFPTTPLILAKVNDAFSNIYKTLGYRGHYSTEIRITKEGKPYFIDPTCRAPSPPSELMSEIYSNYAEAVYSIATGKLPILKPIAPYGAEIILTSPWHTDHELCIEIPKDLIPYIKLKNHTKRGSHYYCIPNDNGGFFGAVVTTGSTLKAATSKALDIVSEIKCDELEFSSSLFDTADEAIQAGGKFSVGF